MNSRFGRAFRYTLKMYLRAVGILLLVVALIPALLIVLTLSFSGSNSNFNGFTMANGIFGLVMGIAAFRENHRLMNQFGVSRRTAFLADEAATVVAALAVGAGSTVIMALYQTLLPASLDITVDDIYLHLYSGGYLGCVAFSAGLTLALALVGQMLSAFYWRVSKFVAVVVSVTLGALLLFGFPVLLFSILGAAGFWQAVGAALAALGRFFISGTAQAVTVFLAMGAAAMACTWLLFRRAYIRAVK